jgi:exosortase/archaeosortase family protein
MQQHPLKLDAGSHNNGPGADAFALSLAKALVIAVAIPMSVAKNGLRIFVLAMLTTRVDRSFIDGRLHHQGGIIYFLIALAAIILLIWAFRRGEQQSYALTMTNRQK